jgi:hypothetical protein
MAECDWWERAVAAFRASSKGAIMKYAIECQGSIYGLFDDDRLAADWPLNHCTGRHWRCRPLREPAGERV